MSEQATTLNLATAWEAVADAVGDQTVLAVGGRRTSWADYDHRAACLAGTLRSRGLDAGSKVALYCYNGVEYPEAQYAAFKLRCVPANVNYRYLGDELAYILDNSDAEALFFDHSLADRVDDVREGFPDLKALVQVGGGDTPSWAISYEEALASSPMPRIDRSGSDLWFLYTGGTTGMPKAVMWSHDSLFANMAKTFASLGEALPRTADEVAAAASRVSTAGSRVRQLCAAPLMHGTSGLSSLATLTHGGMIATLGQGSFDPDELWTVVESEKITMVTIVGDAFARPMLDSLDRASSAGRSWDLSTLRLLLSSGVMFSAPVKAGLLAHHDCTIVDVLGSSEGTGMGSQVTSRELRDAGTARFSLGERARVFNDDGQDVVPGSGERGRLALGDPIPLGYYKDPEKTEETFPVIGGRRWSIPGDWATVETDGSITLLGRGSACINTGGEKVYPEEVEEAIKEHPGVADCNVVGLPDERWGQAVAAVVELNAANGEAIDEEALNRYSRTVLAGYKVPKRILLVDLIRRGPNGKPDYRWAREVLEGSS
ncbi:MAG: AMP-binding protein [Actinobacteria bacterium]|jgi:fatty-acyl-CoA synthase|nr:AMP-binding protein [Actinomycetota bacterium]MBT3687770.1 AMP-binding protein [Actinomycetota bacterium]MBT4037032.1 AMP-binding protein [Actinomycetota bacterium]MBT4344179.1 AMP-binding protein [Actinomycetota bacterium]MBT4786054.1 AMP-binding protein [Actinomycetota bacterium]